jgi:hypothetical protein
LARGLGVTDDTLGKPSIERTETLVVVAQKLAGRHARGVANHGRDVARRDFGLGHALGPCDGDLGNGQGAARLGALARIARRKAEEGRGDIRGEGNAALGCQGIQADFDHFVQRGRLGWRQQDRFQAVHEVGGTDLDAPQVGWRQAEDPTSSRASAREQLKDTIATFRPEPGRAFKNDGHGERGAAMESLQHRARGGWRSHVAGWKDWRLQARGRQCR